MSRVADQILRSVAEAKRRDYLPAPELDPGFLDFDDEVDRVAALLHRIDFITAHRLLPMARTPSGQVDLASTWEKETPGTRQQFRHRAAVVLEFAVKGRELRERPEENVA